jgi:hypothetical protein
VYFECFKKNRVFIVVQKVFVIWPLPGIDVLLNGSNVLAALRGGPPRQVAFLQEFQLVLKPFHNRVNNRIDPRSHAPGLARMRRLYVAAHVPSLQQQAIAYPV